MGRKPKKKKNKIPKHSLNPTTFKQAKHIKNPEGYQHQLIAWHFRCMDNGGKWPCLHENLQAILPRLHEYEQKRWNEIMQAKNNHPMPIEKIVPEAQRRLDSLGHGDTGTLYQLEIKNGQGMQRLWGRRQENVFQILWWDPNHTVYPVRK